MHVAFVSEPTYVRFTKLVCSFRVTAQVPQLHKTASEITVIINDVYYEIRKRKNRVIFGCFAKQLRNGSSCSPVSPLVRMQQRNFHLRDLREISYSRVTKRCPQVAMLVKIVRNCRHFT